MLADFRSDRAVWPDSVARIARSFLAVSFVTGLTACSVSSPLQEVSSTASKKSIQVAAPPVRVTSLEKAWKQSKPQKLAMVYHGSAPYICSPSGFGRKSHCALRTSYR